MSGGERKYLRLADWIAVRDLGLDPGLRPSGMRPRDADPELTLASRPRHLYSGGFRLYPKRPSPFATDDRSRDVDRILAALGIKPR